MTLMLLLNNIFKILGIPSDDNPVRSWKGFTNYKLTNLCDSENFVQKSLLNIEKTYPKIVNIIRKMLEYDPDNRISCAGALQLFKD